MGVTITSLSHPNAPELRLNGIILRLVLLESYKTTCVNGTATVVESNIQGRRECKKIAFPTGSRFELSQHYHITLVVVSGIEVKAWINEYINVKQWDVITLQYPNFNDGLTKPPLRLGQWWVITSHCFTWMWLLTHVHVSKRGPGSAPICCGLLIDNEIINHRTPMNYVHRLHFVVFRCHLLPDDPYLAALLVNYGNSNLNCFGDTIFYQLASYLSHRDQRSNTDESGQSLVHNELLSSPLQNQAQQNRVHIYVG